MNIFSRRRTVSHKLNELAEDLSTIIVTTTAVAKAQTQIVETLTAQLDRLRPSRLAWVQAVALLLLSGALIVLSSAIIATIDRAASEESAFHQRAQAYRVQAVAEVVEALGPVNETIALRTSRPAPISNRQFQSLLLHESRITLSEDNTAEKLLRAADVIDAKANELQPSSNLELFAQSALGVGSALFGAVLGWIITVILAEVRWRREIKPTLSNLSSQPVSSRNQ
jgi:hypothetical protein